ncbi:hypothetical protein ACWDYJ_30275 [Streptomyces sp. NPDC003042]
MRIRIACSAVLAALALMFLIPSSAQAHGDTLKVLVTGHRQGHVTTDITWENDGDAVDKGVAATVNAVSVDGTRSLGPWRLVRDAGASPAGWTTAEILPPGAWKVTVDVGFPALGHGEGDVAVPVVDPSPPDGAPATTAPVPVTPSPSPSPTQARTPAADTSGHAAWWTTAGVAATALAGAAVGYVIRRRRGRSNT